MCATAKDFGIDEKEVREWCRQKPELMKTCAEGRGKRKRCSGDLCIVYKTRLLHSEYCICGNCICVKTLAFLRKR